MAVSAVTRRIGDAANRAGKWERVSESSRGTIRASLAVRKPALRPPPVRRALVTDGRIVKLFVGQGYGFIRVSNDRDIFFHRSDVREGSSFNEFVIGDSVTFELLEDPISGARALQVNLRRRRR